MFKESINSFVGGLDSDSDVRVQKPNTYRRAENVEITGEGEFFSIKNLKGSTLKRRYVGRFEGVSGYSYKSRKVVWSVSCNFKFSNNSEELTPAIVWCTDEEVEFNGSTHRYNDFFVYNTHDNSAKAIFTDIDDDAYIGMSSSYDYDLVISAEGGYEILYLTDDNNEPRYLNLKMGGNNGSTEDHFSLLPLGNLNMLKYKEVKNGGNLASGSYQFSFMYYDTETGRSSRPSLLTNPIPVYPSEIPSLGSVVNGNIVEKVCGGLPNEKANKSIILSFIDDYKEPEKGMYDSIILITVKNVDGSKTPDTKAYYSDPNTSWYSGDDISYDGSITESDKAIESVVLDNVPIKSAKTLEIKEGYMFLGGVKFRDLKLKDGEGTLKNASLNRKNIGASSNYVYEGARGSKEVGEWIIPDAMERFGTTTNNFKSDGIGYKDPLNCANYKSEMRGEVVRYGVTYMDKWGNWSAVKALDFKDFSEYSLRVSNFSSASLSMKAFDDKSGVTTFFLSSNDGNFNYNDIKIGGKVALRDVNNNYLAHAYIKNYERERLSDTNTFYDYLTIEGRSSTLMQLTKNISFIAQENGKMSDGSLSHTSTSDWKFPERMHPKGALFNTTENSHGSIASLGVNIDIDDAPDWAVSSAIVRVPRIKNYVDQTPVVNSVVVQPSVVKGKGAEGDGGDIKGSIFPSSLNTPASQSFCRDRGLPVEDWEFEKPFHSMASWITNVISRRFAPASSCFLYPTEMMYQNPDSKAYYDDTISVDDEIRVVDYASTMSTRGVLITDSSFFLEDSVYKENGYAYRGAAVDRSGGLEDKFGIGKPNDLEQNSTSLRADTSVSYFGTDDVNSYKKRVYPFAVDETNRSIHLFSKRKVTDFIRIEDVSQNVAKIPHSVANKKVTNSIFNYKAIYGMYSDELNSDTFNSYGGSDVQRSLFVNLSYLVGDPTFFSCKEDVNQYSDENYSIGWGDYAKSVLSFNNVSKGWGENLNVQPQMLKSSSVIQAEGDYSPDKAQYSRNYFSHTEGSFKVVPIANISRGLPDNRYGDLDKEHLFTFTGAFSNKVSSKQSFEVFGGDTFIGKHNVKTSDTFFANRFIDDNKGGGSPNQPIPKNWNQILSVYIESAINVDLQGENSRYPVVDDETMLAYSGRYTYPYHFGYSVNNTLKSFISLPDTYEETSSYKSRVLYSEKHILNSRDGNYGVYRADAYYDLEETYGGITKLLKLYDDNIYALQEKSFSIIPVGKSQLEDSTGGSLVVNTESVISTPRYFLNNNGCQDLDSVSVTDKAVIWLDSNNKEVWKFAPSGAPQKISDKGVYGLVRELIPDSVNYTNSYVSGYYDFVRSKYYLFTNENTRALVWNDTLNIWESEFVYNKVGDTKQTVIANMLTADDKFFSINIETDEDGLISAEIYRMFDDDAKYGNFFGLKNPSYLDLIVNAENPEYKTLDVVNIDSNKPLSTMNVVAYDEEDVVSQTGVQNINTKRRQGTYEIPTLRSQSNKGRMRGKWFKLEFTIDNVEGYSVRILGVVNRFRISFRNLISKRQR